MKGKLWRAAALSKEPALTWQDGPLPWRGEFSLWHPAPSPPPREWSLQSEL
jgi:hypothetical protein